MISPLAARVPATTEPLPPPVIDPVDYAGAMRWLDVERANLTAAITYAAEHGFGASAWPTRCVPTCSRTGWGMTGGSRHGHVGDYRLAAEHFGQAVASCRRVGRRTGESSALCYVGTAENCLGRLEPAITHLNGALDIGRELGSPDDQARALTNLAFALVCRGRLADAVDHSRRALSLYEEFSYPRGKIAARDNLLIALRALGVRPGALEAATHNLELAREIDSKNHQAPALCRLATLHGDDGRCPLWRC